MEIPYFYQEQPMDWLDIPDLGNCCIEANDDKGLKMYIATITRYGVTKILTYGPIHPDHFGVLKETLYKIERMNYNLGKLKTAIASFLNSPKYMNITQARLIDLSELKEAMYHPFLIFQHDSPQGDDSYE